jgi:hypothetical protein
MKWQVGEKAWQKIFMLISVPPEQSYNGHFLQGRPSTEFITSSRYIKIKVEQYGIYLFICLGFAVMSLG